jgi:hypothetical protein
VLHACEPERRLPDARLAFEHERRRATVVLLDEGVTAASSASLPTISVVMAHTMVSQLEKPRRRDFSVAGF